MELKILKGRQLINSGLATAVAGEDFAGFETNVQKANTAAVKMYRKIGFRLEENPCNAASWTAKAGRELITDSPVVGLLDRWREKSARAAARGRESLTRSGPLSTTTRPTLFAFTPRLI